MKSDSISQAIKFLQGQEEYPIEFYFHDLIDDLKESRRINLWLAKKLETVNEQLFESNLKNGILIQVSKNAQEWLETAKEAVKQGKNND